MTIEHVRVLWVWFSLDQQHERICRSPTAIVQETALMSGVTQVNSVLTGIETTHCH